MTPPGGPKRNSGLDDCRQGEFAAMRKIAGYVIMAGIATLVVGSAELMAQTGGGATLVGTVRDATGAIVAGAKVNVVNTETAFVTETTTKEDGGYYLPYLAPGS